MVATGQGLVVLALGFFGLAALASNARPTKPTPPSRPTNPTIFLAMYGTPMVDIVETRLKRYIQPQDIMYVNSGGTGALNMPWVNNTIARLFRTFPANIIVASTSGHKNLNILASQVSPAIERIAYNYEPNYTNIPEFSWDFETTLDNMREAKLIAQTYGKTLMVSPTGRPLLTTIKGVQYNWDYAVIGQQVDFQIIQTQTYCKPNGASFQDAITKLVSQYKGKFDSWAPQVTTSLADTNGVSAQEGYECTLEAFDAGVSSISLWWHSNTPEYVEEYLSLLGR